MYQTAPHCTYDSKIEVWCSAIMVLVKPHRKVQCYKWPKTIPNHTANTPIKSNKMKHTFKLSKRKTLEKKKEERSRKMKIQGQTKKKKQALVTWRWWPETWWQRGLWYIFLLHSLFFFLCIFVTNDSHLSAGSFDIRQYS